MHQALKTPEIITEILSHLCSPRDLSSLNLELSQEEKSSLLAAALTCKRFNNPALDFLWFFMTDLVPLFKIIENFSLSNSVSYVLSSELMYRSNTTLQSSTGFIAGPMETKNLEHFDSYAFRICSFSSKIATPDLSPAFTRISYANGRTVLLKRLRQLRIVPWIKFHGFLLLLFHPGLVNLSLRLCLHDSVDSAIIFQFLPERCPNIHRLDVAAVNPTFIPLVLTSMCRMQKVENFSLSLSDDPNPSVLNIIS